MRPPNPSRLKADMGPPGSRIGCFRTCSGSTTAQGLNGSRAIDPPSVAFHLSHSVSTLKLNRISRLHTRPARTPVNASPPPSQAEAHDSGPMWLATPSSYDSFIHTILPVLPGAFGTCYNPPVKRKIFSCDLEGTENRFSFGDTSPASPHGLPIDSTNLSLRRTLNLIVTFIRCIPLERDHPSSLIQIPKFK